MYVSAPMLCVRSIVAVGSADNESHGDHVTVNIIVVPYIEHAVLFPAQCCCMWRVEGRAVWTVEGGALCGMSYKLFHSGLASGQCE